MAENFSPPEFLVDLLNARSPSGYEQETQAVVDKYMEPVADVYEKDAMGNRFSIVNPGGDPTLMFAGHIDELGLQIQYIDDNGFIYFNTIGGHDTTIISGRRVSVLTKNGVVKGVTGKRAIHLMSPEDRKKVPEVHDIWIDIGATSRDEALKRVRMGDPIVYDVSFQHIHGTRCAARAFDDKAGAYLILEATRRLAKDKPQAKIVGVATTQEEIGCRGAVTGAYNAKPNVAIAVDVTHATDHPDCDKRKHGFTKMGKGPVINRSPNVNPLLFERLVEVAEKEGIPHQLESYPKDTPTDARSIQLSRKGVATGLVSIPLRYMHTPSEMVDLEDIENGVKLLVAFAKSLKAGEKFIF